ncbi:MAG: queuosine precursor transporter [Cyclobacteriaceae bacterium]|nr:queuosine precursor transporter [Cyclobacteriaceae bacterium]
MSAAPDTRIIKDKRTHLFIILSAIFLTNAILAELIGVKIFSLERTIGLNPAEINLFLDTPLSFNLTAGVVIWPVVFLTTDVINEYFGKNGVKKISFLTVGCIAFIFVVIYLVTMLPPASFWIDLNNQDFDGNPFNINYAFRIIFRQGLGIIVGSLVAFLISQLLDVFVFQRLRSITGHKMVWLRATGSTLVSQFIDSFVVLGIAFYVFGNWNSEQIFSVGLINYMYKFIIAIVLTPVIYMAHHLIDRYLGPRLADKMKEEASLDKSFF